MSVYNNHLCVVGLVMLAASNVYCSYINSFYPGRGSSQTNSYYTSPLYCSSSSRYSKPYPNTSCYNAATRSTCCMRSYTKSEKGVVQQECLCGSVDESSPTDNPRPSVVSTATTASTTTKASTTQTTSATTTSTPTTVITSTTTASTTTAPFKSLCSASSFRLMNGEAVDDVCTFAGVANITQREGTIQSCSAVYTRARINGVLKSAFLTTKACKDGIERVSKSNIISEIQIGIQAFPVTAPVFNLVDGVKGVAYLEIVERYANWLRDKDTCQRLACPYDKTTMNGQLDFGDCKIVSWGATSAAPAFIHNGLHESAIILDPSGCSSIPNMFGAADTMCFKTKSGAKLYSQGDSGAPIYCKALANGEWILVGIAAEQLNWGKSAELKVIPYPG